MYQGSNVKSEGFHRRGIRSSWDAGQLVRKPTRTPQVMRKPTRTPTTSGGSQSINLVQAVAAVFSQNSHLD
jgi:hypothetical protein